MCSGVHTELYDAMVAKDEGNIAMVRAHVKSIRESPYIPLGLEDQIESLEKWLETQ